MQRHLQTSFPSPNAERDAPIFEHETAPIPTQSSKITAPAMTPAPASAPAPIPAVQVAQQQQQQQQQQSSPKSLSRSKSSPKKERDKTKGSKKATKRAAAEKELAGLQTGTVRKGESVREKLLRWIHKLGSSSSSSSSR
jgi:type IV secretory pathway VirB10-like protein